MAKVPGLKLSKNEVSQRINLKELFGVSFAGQSALAQAIGQAMIDKIIERTENNKSVDGNALKKYSKEYTESLDFKAFGKSKDDVNMKLTGQMLGTIDIVEQTANTIKIGWNDDEENAKAYNHNTGDTVPKRPFFGLNEKELAEIKEKFQPEVEAIRGSTIQSPERTTVADILRGTFFRTIVEGDE